MNTNSSWSHAAACLALALCIPALLHAGTGTDISPSNATIDTRDKNEPGLAITMHRLTGEALVNAGSGAGIDTPLMVRGNNPALLDRQPQLPVSGSINVVSDAPAQSGLVADGVTPLLFRVSATSPVNTPVTYTAELKAGSSFQKPGPDLNGRLWVLKNGTFEQSRTFTLSSENSTAYLALGPVRSMELEDNRKGSPSAAILKFHLIVKSSTTSDPRGIVLGIRKPPVVFVHGYNAGNSTWEVIYFLNGFRNDRGNDFIIPVGYGNVKNNYENTYGDLVSLAQTLQFELSEKVEERKGTASWPADKWAWTRYDAVGHSQGGVLLRLLCSSQETSGNFSPPFPPFRQPANHHRGRFHRVVTVGSPHFGSTMAHLGRGMLDRNLDFGENLVGWFGNKERLLQAKFKINQPSSGPDTPQQLNNRYTPDPSSRIHMLGATIDKGQVPGPRPGFATLPRVFKAVYLQKGDDSNKVSGQKWGEWIAPYGSDGVVDLCSQMASSNPNSPLPNASRMSSSDDIAHASADPSPFVPFDTWSTETNDLSVAGKLLDLLNNNDPSPPFGPFPSAADCEALHFQMNDTANAIEQIIGHIEFMQKPLREKLWGFQGNPGIAAIDEPLPTRMSDEPLPIPMDDPPSSAQTVNLTLQPPVGESPNGPVVWLVLVYGPDGVTTEGVTLTPSGTYGENLQIDIAAGVIGEVVASVQFPSTSDKTVIGEAGVVASRPPGVLTGIELRPDAIAMPAGPSLPLEVWGVYDSGSKVRLYTEAANTTWLSNDPAVATVDDEGIVTLMAPGGTTVQATYSGVHSTASAINVWAPPPVITSGAVVSASAVQPFSYQITADGSPVSYTARDLPEGLSLNSASGLISGIPLYEGLFHILVGALNADAQEGNRELALTVTGTNQPPTAIGLDNGSVPAMQPSGTLVGRLATADVNPLDTFTYALVAGTGAADNSLFTISGDELFTTTIIDPASKPECSIRLRATDSGGLSVEQFMVLPLLGGPIISSAPQGAIVFAGRSFVLECEASGREPLLFQWRQDGVDIPGAHGRTLEMTDGSPGTSSYTVRVENAYGTETSAAAAVQVVPLSFGGWASQFTTPESGEIPPDGDLNHDGLSNLLDFAFNRNPLLGGPADRPFGGIVRDGAENLLTLTHRRSRFADLVYLYEWSPNMAQWFPFAPIMTVPDPDADGDGATELIEAGRAIQPGESSGFLRLKVSEP